MKRRTLLKKTALAAASPLALGMFHARRASAASFRNKDVYTDGQFDVEKGKDAIMALCERLGYHVFPELRDGLWVSDYGTGQFSKLGLAAYQFANQHEGGAFMLMELFLMPGQMLPEHWHLEGDHGITKNEGWVIRWGKSYIGGVGENNMADFPQIKIPKCHCNGTTSTHHVVEAKPGSFTPLAKVGTRHWQFAGPEGAILSEVANLHTGTAVRHSDKAVNDQFLGD